MSTSTYIRPGWDDDSDPELPDHTSYMLSVTEDGVIMVDGVPEDDSQTCDLTYGSDFIFFIGDQEVSLSDYLAAIHAARSS